MFTFIPGQGQNASDCGMSSEDIPNSFIKFNNLYNYAYIIFGIYITFVSAKVIVIYGIKTTVFNFSASFKHYR